jgi:hypothetical protein
MARWLPIGHSHLPTRWASEGPKPARITLTIPRRAQKVSVSVLAARAVVELLPVVFQGIDFLEAYPDAADQTWFLGGAGL